MKKTALTILKIVMLSVIFTSLYTIQPKIGYACSCAGPNTVQQELQKKTAVFTGKAVSVKVNEGLFRSSADPVQVTLEVDQVWKGQVGKKQIVYTARDGASCGFKFESGHEYVVYAYSNNDRLETNMCDRTKLLASAAEDLNLLGEGKQISPYSDREETNRVQAVWYLLAAFVLGVASWFAINRAKRRGK